MNPCQPRRRTFAVGFLGLLVTLLRQCPAFPGDPLPPDREKQFLRVLAEGYLANRATFQFLSCRYTIVEGKTQSPEKAHQGEITPGVVTDCLWIVDGAKERCSMQPRPRGVSKETKTGKGAPPPGPPDGSSGVRAADGPTPGDYLNGDEIQLTHRPSGLLVNLWTREQPMPNPFITPTSMGVMGDNEWASPGKRILEFLDEGLSCTLEGKEDFHGRELVSVRLVDRDQREVKYAMDPSRGYLPIRMVFKSLNTELVIADVQECSGGRWFPKRSVNVSGQKPPFFVREIRVLELDADKRPRPSDFMIDLAANTSVHNVPHPTSAFRLAEPMKVGLEELSVLLGRCSQQRAAAETKVVVAAPAGRSRTLVLVGVLVLGVIFVAVLVLARHRRAISPRSRP